MQDGNLVGVLLNAGMAGLVLILFLRDWITPKPGVDRLVREAERWRKLYETERAAHNLTRKAYAEETRAALQAASEGTQVAAALLAEIKRHSEAAR